MSRDEHPTRERGRAPSALASIGTLVLAVLVPKCPLCVAAALSALGVGATAASALAPAVRPLVFVVAATAVVGLAIAEGRRLARKRRHTETGTHSCCAP
jgi:hypothetical protein